MDTNNLKGLMEAYSEVYASQENIDEGLRSAVKRLLGGGKKEAEAPKPESRGEQLRKKYNVGPEKSDTSAKRQILNRSRARAERDERDYGGSKYSKSVAQKSKAAHERYLKAGYSKYGADLKHGSGNKARKRAAALNREEFEFIVNALIEEGYDLSSYTWDEMYEICLDEAVEQIDEISQKTAISAYAASKTGEFEGADSDRDIKRTDNLEKHIKRKFGDKAVKHAERAADAQTFGRKDASGRSKQRPQPRIQRSDYRTTQDGKMHKQDQRELKTNLRIKRDRRLRAEDFDIFDVVLEFLQVEGFAETLEEAEWMMANLLDKETIDIIVEAMHEDEDEEDEKEMKKGKKNKKDDEEEDEEEDDELSEASYSAKAARAGKDIGKPGKAFAKIAKSAAKRYGSKERGEKVAGAVLAKLRVKRG